MKNFIKALTLSVLILFGFATYQVFAEDDSQNSGVIINKDATVKYGKKYGAAWVWYEFDSPAASSSSFTVMAGAARPGGTYSYDGRCAGATGFWALTALLYNTSTGSYDGRPAGMIRNSETDLAGGSYPIHYAGDLGGVSPVDNANGAHAVRYASSEDEVRAAYAGANNKQYTWDEESLLCEKDGNKVRIHSQSTVTFEGAKSIPVLDGTSTLARTVPKTQTQGYATFDHYLLVEDAVSAEVGRVDTTITYSTGETVPGPGGSTSISAFGETDPTTGMKMTHVVVGFGYSFAIPAGGITICQTIHYTPQVITYAPGGGITTADEGRSSRACLTILRGNARAKGACEEFGFAAGFGKGINKGEVNVANFNQTSVFFGRDWEEKTIYAKPGDEVRFAYCYGFGTYAIAKTTHDSTGTDVVPAAWFRIKASPNNYYLFDRYRQFPTDDPMTETSRYYIPKDYDNMAEPIGAPPVDETKPYEIDFYSPSNYASDKFDCWWYYKSDPYVNGTYQILGSPSGVSPCKAKGAGSEIPKSMTGYPVNLDWTVVGKTISQTIEYYNVRAWLNKKSDIITGGCGCNDGSGEEADTTDIPEFDSPLHTMTSNRQRYGQYVESCKEDGTCTCGCSYGETGCSCSAPDATHSTYYNCSRSDCKNYKTEPEFPHGSWGHYTAYYDCNRGRAAGCNPLKDIASDTATIKIPYNFMTHVQSSISADEKIYAGETVSYQLSADLLDRKNNLVSTVSYLTHTPSDTKVQAVRFTTSSSSPGDVSENIKADVPGGDLCNYFTARFENVKCQDIASQTGTFNGQGLLGGPVNMMSISNTEAVPDIAVGYKFCVAIGVSHTDSHDMPERFEVSEDGTSMGNTSPHWHVSGVSCRSIAKKPNFQTWNAGTYTGGNIVTSTSPKAIDAALGDSPHTDSIFGSWTEYSLIGGFNARISGLASGAARGYLNGNSADDYCSVSKMSIKNSTCGSDYVGVSGISNVSVDDLLRQIRTRYTDSSHSNPGNLIQLNNETGASYVYYEGGREINGFALYNETRVYEVTGDVYIKGNLCYGAGTCRSGNGSIVIGSANQTVYGLTTSEQGDLASGNGGRSNPGSGGISKLPQIIIIADNIYIDQSVTQIDAWLFAYHEDEGNWVGGTVDTCVNGSVPGLDANTCNKTLIINGPVFADNIKLNRTAGAYDGPGSGIDAGKDLSSSGGNTFPAGVSGSTDSDYGSETPAEIFNLRPDVYLWTYSQSDRYTQAVVTYTRELAPRY